jgi:hypothetical protein
MSQITFDQPSTGNVNSNQDALAVLNSGSGNAVTGNSKEGATGVFGSSAGGVGVRGESQKVRIDEDGNYAVVNDGVFGLGKNGVHGQSPSPTDSGVWGENTGAGYGVAGSTNSPNAAGVWGDNQGAGPGVRGTSVGGEGVHGESKSHTWAGVTGIARDPAGIGPGVWAESQGLGPGIVAIGKPAGQFRGDIEVTGDIRLMNADCAEEFDISGTDKIDPGTVMVIDDQGALHASKQAYDKRVAGVISGAGEGRPAIVLDKQNTGGTRMPIGLVGKVYCKVDAQYSPIDVGDLLTTSPTPGHAMKADDPLKAF